MSQREELEEEAQTKKGNWSLQIESAALLKVSV